MLLTDRERRTFLRRVGLLAGNGLMAGALVGATQHKVTYQGKKSDKDKDDVTPAEDLMREHGLLRRVLLAYDEFVRRLESREQVDPGLVTSSAEVVKRFVEGYHEKQEEDYVFPRLQKAGKEVALVTVLLQQHAAGRVVTEKIRTVAGGGMKSDEERRRLKELLSAFAWMYRPHAAREDTNLFPAFRSVLSANEYDSLGEQFEKNETRMFGEGGFEKYVDQVSRIERELGIHDLQQFTPKIQG